MEQNASNLELSPGPQSLMTGAGAGASLYIINLCASIAPVDTSGKNLPGLENYRLYQVARVEDGRTRHRLRLGFFTSESHAKSVLTVVRQQYPTAFTASLCEEDRRFTRGYLPQSAPAQPDATAAPPPAAKAAPAIKPEAPTAKDAPAARPEPPAAKDASAAKPQTPAPTAKAPVAQTAPPTVKPAPKESASAPAAKARTQPSVKPAAPASNHQAAAPRPASSAPAASTKSAPAPAKPVQARKPLTAPTEAPALTFSDPPPAAPRKQSAGEPNQPFHVGKGVQIADLPITLQDEAPAAPPAARTASVAPSKPASAPASAHPAAPPQVMTGASRLPELDSTQTIRALTSAELEDDSQEKVFAIELAASERPVNLDALPHLDIFEAYRPYCVAIAGGGKIVHSLRLGFFREAVSAEAVCGYLQAFFASPTAVRVSLAEHERFKNAPMRKPQPADPAGPAKVIELSDARASRPPAATLATKAPTPRTDASGSFRRPEPSRSSGSSGKYKAPPVKQSLEQQLLDEAREVELSESGIRKVPKNDSLLSRLVGKLKNSE